MKPSMTNESRTDLINISKKSIFGLLDDLKNDINKVDLYMKKEDFETLFAEVQEKLSKINEKIDHIKTLPIHN